MIILNTLNMKLLLSYLLCVWWVAELPCHTLALTVFEEKITKLQPWARLVFSGLEFCRTCQISAGEETGFVYGLFTADHMERSEVKRLIGGKQK